MYLEDLHLLCCPKSGETLQINYIAQADNDGEILEGELRSSSGKNSYIVRNGIPRFVEHTDYNASWDYKWHEIDSGKGLNYKILDKNDPAYEIHDLFDRNNHDGQAFTFAKGRIALDLGCGIGQYSLRLLQEFEPTKVVSMDLTRGVDVFRQIMLEKFPHYKSKILMVQASVFEMPFPKETFDYVMSLGVLMHTGNTLNAIEGAAQVLKNNGHINFWLYASEPVPYESSEVGRQSKRTIEYIYLLLVYVVVWFWIHFFRLLPFKLTVSIVRLFSSGLWYRISRLPIVGKLTQIIFMTVQHPDFDYRFINNYDGWINTWSDTWSEHEIFPTLRENNIVIRGVSRWRLGIWGIKDSQFYQNL